MKSKILYLSDLKFNLETWKRELRFHFNEMDTFQEKDVISKLMHRCKAKMNNINAVNYNENIDGRLQNEQHTLRDDMRTYIKLHYDLKEEMMNYFLVWL